MLRNSGTQFDPEVVDAFQRMVRNNPDGFRDEHDEFGSRVVEQSDNGISRTRKHQTPELTTID